MSEEITQINHHIEDLRRRFLKILIAVGIITIFIMTFHATPVNVFGTTLYYPYPQPLDNIAAQITDFMRINLVPENVQLIQTAPGQAFFAQIYIAALVGIVASMPIIVSQLANFLKHNRFCYVCFTIPNCVWTIFSTSTNHVCIKSIWHD